MCLLFGSPLFWFVVVLFVDFFWDVDVVGFTLFVCFVLIVLDVFGCFAGLLNYSCLFSVLCWFDCAVSVCG